MKIGCRAHDFGRWSEEELPRKVRDAGFEAVQLALTKGIEGIETFNDITPARLERVRKGFDDAGVEIAVLGCYIEPSLPERDARLEQVGYFLSGLEYAKALGAPIVATETTWFYPEVVGEAARETAYADLLDSVRRMAECAEKLDVDVGIEPVTVHTLNSAKLARRLLDEVGSDKIKIVYDPVNMIPEENLEKQVTRQEEIFAEFTSLLGKEIRAVHLKGMAVEHGKKVWSNIDKGVMRLQMVVDWLKRHYPDITLLREEVIPDSAAQDLAALRALAGR